MIHCLTIDVEDWYHYYNIETWYSFPARVEEPIRWILDQLDKRKIKATFFVLGFIAERHPDLVKEIFQKGHEIGCHGYDHNLVFEKTPNEFEIDIKRALYCIETATGFRPNLYRAPAFSINAQTPWVWKILYKNGIRRDSSIKVNRMKMGGFTNLPEIPFKFLIGQGCFMEEFPLLPIRIFGIDIYYPGSGYFRMAPTKLIIKNIQTLKKPIVFYIHPRDMDPDQPKIKELSILRGWYTYFNVEGCREKFIKLLDSIEFCSLRDFGKNYNIREIDFQI